MFCLVASNPSTSVAGVRSSAAPLCKEDTAVCGGVEEIGICFRQWCVAGSLARKEDRVRSVASGRTILGPGEPAIHLHCSRICRWWIRKRPADEGSRGGIGDGPGRVAVG